MDLNAAPSFSFAATAVTYGPCTDVVRGLRVDVLLCVTVYGRVVVNVTACLFRRHVCQPLIHCLVVIQTRQSMHDTTLRSYTAVRCWILSRI